MDLFKWFLLCEIPNIEMNFRTAEIWAYLPSLHTRNCKGSLRMKRTPTKVQRTFKTKWRMVTRSSSENIQTQYWIRFTLQSTTKLNTSVLLKQSGCWMHILFTNHQMTVFQSASIQIQACSESSFLRTRFWSSGSLWGDRFGMLICQELLWRMKSVLERRSPRLQQQCFANW